MMQWVARQSVAGRVLAIGLIALALISALFALLASLSQAKPESATWTAIWLLGNLAAVAYLVPAIIAALRRHRNDGAILALNILFGWTFVGWGVALVWALVVAAPISGEVAIRIGRANGGSP